MTKEDIIRMAHEVFDVQTDSRERTTFSGDSYAIEAFAVLVASAEREACAKMCDDLDDELPDGLAGWQYGEAIRARG